MKVMITVLGTSKSGKSLFLSEAKRWLEHTMKEERYFFAKDVVVYNDSRAGVESLVATVDMR